MISNMLYPTQSIINSLNTSNYVLDGGATNTTESGALALSNLVSNLVTLSNQYLDSVKEEIERVKEVPNVIPRYYAMHRFTMPMRFILK